MSDDVIAAMAKLRKALEKRMRMADRAEELAARERERGGAPRAVRAGALAAFDMAALARRLRPMLEYDGRGWRGIAAEIGVTSPDLSRVMAGQAIAYEKVRAICEWAGLDPDRFYRPAAGAPKPRKTPRKTAVGSRGSAVGCFTGKALKQASSAEGRKPDRASGVVARPSAASGEAAASGGQNP